MRQVRALDAGSLGRKTITPAGGGPVPSSALGRRVRCGRSGDMELRDYIAALRRHRPTWLGLTVVGLILALVVVQLTPHTYRATAQVFVSSSTEGSPQFVAQRVKSYPDVAVSAAVLVPAAEHLGLDTGVAQLRDQVTASNPV